ncbi:MAG: aromatic amino acid transport family protein [bacterium]|nr:aromatic amino acid transport family protein [bacterium]
MNKKHFLAISSLVGTILGAGIFGIPYSITYSGLKPAIFYFIILGIVVTCFHLMFGEIILRNSDNHRFIYYAEKYLGKWGKYAILFSTIVGLGGALLSFIILGGDFLYLVSFQKINPIILAVLFWVFLSFAVLRGFHFVAKLEAILDTIFFILVIFIFASIAPLADFSLIPFSTSNSSGLAYGVILFCLIGWMSVPAARQILGSKENLKSLKKIIISAGIITTIFSAIFGLVFAAISGPLTTPNVFQGISLMVNPQIIALLAVFGTLLISTSFLIIAIYFIDCLVLDLGLNRKYSRCFVLLLPLVLFLLGFRDFILLISALGVILGTIDGIIIILCYKKAKNDYEREPEYELKIPNFILSIFILILLAGAVCFFLP